MNIRTISALAVLVAGSIAPAPALAQSGFYLGGNVGVTRANFDEEQANQDLLGLGFSSASTTVDQSGTGAP